MLKNTNNRLQLQKSFTKDVHNATTEQLLESKRTFEKWKTSTELWALSVIKRELAKRENPSN